MGASREAWEQAQDLDASFVEIHRMQAVIDELAGALRDARAVISVYVPPSERVYIAAVINEALVRSAL